MSELITLGIGSDPTSIAPFVLFGLSPNPLLVRQQSLSPMAGAFGPRFARAVSSGSLSNALPTAVIGGLDGPSHIGAAVAAHDGRRAAFSPASGHRSKLTYAN